MTQGKHFAAGGDHFAALPNKKIHTPKGIARLTVTAATMAAMTGSSLISPFTAFAQTGDGGTQHPAVMSPIAAHAGAASGTGAKSAAQTIADLQKVVDEAKAKEDAAKASYNEVAGPYNEAASARDQAKASYDSAVSAGTAADRAAMDEYARQVAEGKDTADAAGKDLEQAKAGLADAKADASEKDEAYQSALKAAQDAKDALDKAKADAVSATRRQSVPPNRPCATPRLPWTGHRPNWTTPTRRLPMPSPSWLRPSLQRIPPILSSLQPGRTRTRRMRRPQQPAPPMSRRKPTSPQRRQAPAVRSTMRQNRRSRTQRQPSLPHERHSPSASPSSSRHSPLRQRHRPT